MIPITKVYESYSCADGRPSRTGERGFEFRDRSFTFLDLVRELRINFQGATLICANPPSSNTRARIAYTVHTTGGIEVRELCLGKSGPRAAKYWPKAIRAAELL